ncbi:MULTISPECIES: GntR family transcriptional regulator [Aminobacterium]|jgi:DNA-binding GntR family transcriptional regulator|uniref:Transcriptional regulator, GntR family n=1 Tax=Aminobacterium colombiense (strain DSM 12261 / ALA-1) TaxID=572547 RepID=D5ED93_AMICL|nr:MULTISPECIES: GntR family transcriptional regulator [Aminobacterium]MDD2378737.1 GntR family transcriptional regulator [Aminobacterium colombiense]ADE56525.1 transcriptional regulator, GntR family [Aminobacterium colombiense DSM 12261]MDD3767454.1 GntR family transcriptional regulator [Aminobacterium colombiense]MDD4265194.1 GntR family transcriptional regulator [Aminobacterium colombiense]MDD4585400.1 GntR family transcriptional regulator [Aminobacterium colombiense]
MREARLYTTSADYAYQELRHKIITKQLKPGQRLPEVNIAVQMGVSRTPVREALRRLASEGLVIIIPNSGARLAAPTAREIEDTFLVRDQLETLAIRLAAERIGDRHLRRLEEAMIEEGRAIEEKDLEKYLEVNEAFHKAIADASGNRVLAEYVENILARTNAYIVFYDPFYQLETMPSIDAHREILVALRHHDAEKCVKLLRGHLQEAIMGLRKAREEA